MNCGTLHPDQTVLSPINVHILTVTAVLIAITTISLNFTVALSIWRLKMLETLSYRFIFYLSISDCLVGLGVTPIILSLLLLQKKSFCILEYLAQSSTFFVCQFSGVMVVIITVDRYLHMRYLTKYNTYMTKRRASALVWLNLTSCFVTAGALTFATIAGLVFQFELVLVIIYCVLVFAIFFLYTKTYLSLRNRVHHLPSVRKSRVSSTEKKQRFEVIFGKGMIFVLLTTGVSYVPCFLTGTIWGYTKYVCKEEPSSMLHLALFWTIILMYSNSTFNPIIMLSFNRRLRRYIKSKLRSSWYCINNNKMAVNRDSR